MLKRFFQDECGATAIEYGLVTAIISLGVFVALEQLGISLRDDVFSVLAEAMQPQAGPE